MVNWRNEESPLEHRIWVWLEGRSHIVIRYCTPKEAMDTAGARHVENEYSIYDIDHGKWYSYTNPDVRRKMKDTYSKRK